MDLLKYKKIYIWNKNIFALNEFISNIFLVILPYLLSIPGQIIKNHDIRISFPYSDD